MEHALTAFAFSKHGCLYFRQDLPGDVQQEHGDVLLDHPDQSSHLSKYTIGPLTKAELWCSGRENMSLDRGPCKRDHISQMLGFFRIH